VKVGIFSAVHCTTTNNTSTIAVWLEYGEVNVSNFPKGFLNAIISQEGIGWRHFFAGKISQEWLQLQEDSTNKTIGLKRDCYVWGSSAAETTLTYLIKL
jgi:hypothetical protein